jgi:hypothetical protein
MPPKGYTILANSPAYNITTTAATPDKIAVCLNLSTISDRTEFNKARVLHVEDGRLVDRTTSRNYRKRELCGKAKSLSSFVIAQNQKNRFFWFF